MRSLCFTLVLLAHPSGSNANPFTDFVGELLQGLTGVYERKSLLFFSDFSSNLNRNKIPGRLECDYSDPVKSKMCPPITTSPFAHMEPVPKKESSTEASVEESKAEGSDEESSEMQPVSFSKVPLLKCLVDPDDPDCRELQNDESESDQGDQGDQDGEGVTDYPSSFIASAAPSKDDCYGNAIDPRFCASEMPSGTEEPTGTPGDGAYTPPSKPRTGNLPSSGPTDASAGDPPSKPPAGKVPSSGPVSHIHLPLPTLFPVCIVAADAPCKQLSNTLPCHLITLLRL